MSPSAQKSAAQPVSAVPTSISIESFLVEVADALNTTLDLDTLLKRVAELIRRVIDFEIFAILLLNERTQSMRMRFQIGHSPEAQRLSIKVGQGITGQSADRRQAIMVPDVRKEPNYISAHPAVQSELAVPLIAKNRVIGVIDVQSRQVNYFTDDHKRLLSLVASRIAVTVENARLYTRVVRQADTLAVLNEISRELTSILNLDSLLKRVGELLTRVIDFQMFSVLLLDEKDGKLQHRFSLRFKESIHLKHDICIGKGLVGHAAEHREPVLAPDVRKDPRYIALNPETRSELCVPLIYKDKVIGVLDLEHTRRGYFNEGHLRTVSTLAAQLAIAIENARLYEKIAQQEARLERDLSMAREVQVHLLPPCCPTLGTAELAAKFIPAHELGGDMYDFYSYSGSRTAIAIGDVSGKGAPAALFGALASGLLRSTAALEPGPAEMLEAMNLSIAERRLEAQFVSLIFAVWDEERRLMQVANSGLPRPIYCHHGRIEIIEAAGLPLGLFEEAEYDEITIHAAPGDVFLYFSDGIIDESNAAEEQFGRARVEKVVADNCERSADDIVEAIFRAVNKFSGGREPFDDQTIVCMKVKQDGKLETKKKPPAKK